MKNMDKIFAIRGGKRDWYEQVIFIPKENLPKTKQPVNLVAEAEKIIQNYMANSSGKSNTALYTTKAVHQNKYSRRDRSLDVILNICLILSIVLLVMAIYHFVT